MEIWAFLTCFYLAVVIPTVVRGQDGTLQERMWKVNGVDRKALVFVPKGSTGNPHPLIFGFHGHGGSMGNAARTFQYHRIWPEAVVIYMQGLPTPGALTDPKGLRNGWQKNLGDQNDRDLKFFDEVLRTAREEMKIDEKRIFCTGHSNGGAFTYLLWATRGEVFAAVAPSAAGLVKNAQMLKPKPALHVAGESDPLVPYAFQSRMMDRIRKLNGCLDEGKPWKSEGNLKGTWFDSSQGTPFVTLISPGTHTFPKEAPGLIVQFFKEVTADRPSAH